MLKLLLGDPNTRKLKRYQPIVEEINILEAEISKLTDDELRKETHNLKSRISSELDNNTFWAKSRTRNDLKKCLANSDVIISLWVGSEIVGFGRALTDGIYRGVLWDIVIDQNHQGKGFGSLIVKNLLSSKKIKNTKKLYLMTTNKKLFYSQFDFKEVTTQNLLIREI